jgi:DNA ligase-1
MSTFKPMLAQAGDPSALSYPVLLQTKLDGIRAVVLNGKLVSRNLKPIPNAEIRAAMERPEFEGLDGEIIVGPPEAEGCMQRTTSFVMAESKTDEPWAFYAFDKHNHPGTFRARLEAVERVVDDVTWDTLPLFVVDTWVCESPADVEEYEAALLAQGHEGVILRDPNALYKYGRSGKRGPLIKVKRFIDFEAVVIGVYEELHNANEATKDAFGRTERSSHKANKHGKGTLGGLVLRAINGPCEGIEFRCGTGFDAEQRRMLWDFHTRSSEFPIVGRTAKIKSFPVGVKDKPRFPVFLGWRDMEIDG